ncbi:methionyl-tRNA formyltransferase [Candidatus Pseudoscillospira sp. SGI.172]|uniref:methionyl-tRNA formyltransferase n=1 Tax=Candidatus Pseudoscillospira sp. SGI.172 TaxID=3420582 RepID=UPI002A7B449F|nr:methionyl-tRNA formyltransferase [Pseudoflavonifractor sp.]MDY3018494.1 methionyl-tRNA formyltransferase [Oscillospiraceae bacterium]
MRILFMGTPDFAVPSLEALLGAGHTVCGVFTQPDKPKNRGMKLQPTPVKECALSHGIPVFQPVKLRDGTALEQIRALAPELIVVAAYGRILPQDILDCPPKGCINVHSSLLPRYRGAAPINWAILNGDGETGVTIMHMAAALDAGDIIAQASAPIGPDETAPELTARLAELGGALLAETVARIEAGTAERIPQEEEQATLAPMLGKELSPLDFSRSAQALHDQVRGLIPWPAATARVGGVRCKIFATAAERGSGGPGTVLEAGKNGILIACGGDTALRILELQPDGGKRMRAADYLRGHPVEAGSVL